MEYIIGSVYLLSRSGESEAVCSTPVVLLLEICEGLCQPAVSSCPLFGNVLRIGIALKTPWDQTHTLHLLRILERTALPTVAAHCVQTPCLSSDRAGTLVFVDRNIEPKLVDCHR